MKEILLTKTLLPSLVKNTNVFLMFLFHLFRIYLTLLWNIKFQCTMYS